VNPSSEAGARVALAPGARLRGRTLAYSLGLLLLALAAVLAYLPGLKGPFLLDDNFNIVENAGVRMPALTLEHLHDAALSRRGTDYLSRPIPRITFALNFYLSGQTFDALAFKATNLAIHLLNGLLVFVLSLRLLHALRARGGPEAFRGPLWDALPLLVAALWLLHPIQLTSVLYVVQRMTSMAATWVFLGLIAYLAGRERLAAGRERSGLALMGGALALGSAVGFFCKENAVLLAPFALLLELFFCDRSALGQGARRRLLVFWASVLGLMAAAAITAIMAKPELLTQIYQARNFTPVERLLTEARVLFYYLGLMVFPNVREFALYHDDMVVSRSLLSPWTTFASLLGLAALAGVALWGLGRRLMVAFAILWYLAGHSIESTLIGLELVYEHRNYVPSFGLAFAAAYGVLRVAERRRELVRLAVPVAVLCLAVTAFVTHARASSWESRERLAFFHVRNHPESYRAHMEMGSVYDQSGAPVVRTYAAYRDAARASPYATAPLVRMQRIVDGLLTGIEAGEVPEDDETAAPREPRLLHDELIIRRDYLEALDALIAEQFAHRLATYAMNAETIGGLLEFQRCLLTSSPACAPLERVERWLEIALALDVNAKQRSGLLLIAAKIAAFRGDIARAVANVEEAIALMPEEVGFLFELAGLYRVLKDYDAAERTLERLRPLIEREGYRSADFRRLEALIGEERARHEAEAANAGAES